ncbi:MAG TPA: VWA domain-containing protein [Thermoleophilaceae bacterium]
MSERLGIRLTGRLTLLVASLRAGGVRIGIEELLAAHRALGAVDVTDPRLAYRALRPVLCSRHDDLAVFDAAFEEWFGHQRYVPSDVTALDDAGEDPSPPTEVPRDRDFADYSDIDRQAAAAAMRRLAARGPLRRSRRLHSGTRRGAAADGEPPPDPRRTLRTALRRDGEPRQRHWHEAGERPRPLVLVCDVSGSMEPYACMLLQYMQARLADRWRVQAFVFGTRVGEALATLNREHARRIGRGAVVVLLSDGWDRGDPRELEREVAQLARSAQRLIWLDPRMARLDYRPLTRDMQAALAHVAHFRAGNSLQSLEELARLLDGGFS